MVSVSAEKKGKMGVVEKNDDDDLANTTTLIREISKQKSSFDTISVSTEQKGEQVSDVDLVNTTTGVIRGIKMKDSIYVKRAYLGVPYAQPPKRWKRANPILRKDGVLFANETGPDCFGKIVPGTSLSRMSEDCLTLDIYTPVTSTKNHSVMVYLHGGSLVEGSSSSIQSGYFAVSNMTRENVISISVNYRVAILGFFSLQAWEKKQQYPEANFGLFDVIEALKWIQTNVAEFGGDPNRVTVYGQSSGGSLVFALATSPLAGGLFRNAISMSGSPKLSETPTSAAKTYYSEFIANTPCDMEDNVSSCLHALSPETVQNAMPHDWDSASFSFTAFQRNFTYAPVLLVDGVSVVKDYLSAFKDPPEGSPLSLDTFRLMVGTTREEIDFAPGDDVSNFSSEMFQEFVYDHIKPGFGNHVASLAVSRYLNNNSSFSKQQTYAQIVSDATIWCPSLFLLDRANDKIKHRFYTYQTSQRPGHVFCPLSPFQMLPNYCPSFSFHAIDMFMMFQVPWGVSGCCSGDEVSYEYTEDDVRYGNTLAKRFTEFSKTGHVESWDSYGSDRNIVRLEVPGEEMVKNLRVNYCDGLWWDFYERLALIN